MQIKEIYCSAKFKEQFGLLPLFIKKKAVKTESLFRLNTFHPSVRLHKLKGKFEGAWSISVDYKYKIIFTTMPDGVILFVSIGLHSIYNYL